MRRAAQVAVSQGGGAVGKGKLLHAPYSEWARLQVRGQPTCEGRGWWTCVGGSLLLLLLLRLLLLFLLVLKMYAPQVSLLEQRGGRARGPQCHGAGHRCSPVHSAKERADEGAVLDLKESKVCAPQADEPGREGWRGVLWGKDVVAGSVQGLLPVVPGPERTCPPAAPVALLPACKG